MGRWKRRRLAVERDFVQVPARVPLLLSLSCPSSPTKKEAFELEDGRKLVYKQPEAGSKEKTRPIHVLSSFLLAGPVLEPAPWLHRDGASLSTQHSFSGWELMRL